MLKDFVRNEFNSNQDFWDKFNVMVPENFNFAYDVVDHLAQIKPDKTAIVWYDDNGETKIFNFEDLKYYSNKAANFFKNAGIKKGDPVMLILKRRYEFWFCLLALHRRGAICIPATHLLTSNDIIYRNNAADIKMIVSVNEDQVINHIEASEEESPSLETKVLVGGSREGWLDFDSGLESACDVFHRPVGESGTSNDDISLLYFTSGTTGYPKMVQHNFTYPLGHILTAKYWQNVIDGGLHLTIADTGWAKAMWGKIYGQWISGSAIFVYDYERFNPQKMLETKEKFKITTFYAPQTKYRLLIQEFIS